MRYPYRFAASLARALEVWGSWQVLEHELHQRRLVAAEEERRRQGLTL